MSGFLPPGTVLDVGARHMGPWEQLDMATDRSAALSTSADEERQRLLEAWGEAADGKPRRERTLDLAGERRGDIEALLNAWERQCPTR